MDNYDKTSDSTTESKVNDALVDYNRLYTYAEYLEWDIDNKWRELIDGVPYLMSTPTIQHQGISGNLHALFWNYLKGKSCKVYYSPFEVRLKTNTTDNTVLLPDIVVICDHSKFSKRGCVGAPDLVVEILSPSTARHDKIIKFNKYQEAGVREYWILDPDAKTLAVHILTDGKYITSPFTDKDTVPVHVLEGCTIDLTEVFGE